MENNDLKLTPFLRLLADKYFERRKTLPRAPRHMGFKNYDSMTRIELRQLLLSWHFEEMPKSSMDTLFNFFERDDKNPDAINWTKFLSKLERTYYNQGFPQTSKHFGAEVGPCTMKESNTIPSQAKDCGADISSGQLEDVIERIAERVHSKFDKITKKTVLMKLLHDEKMNYSHIDFDQFQRVLVDMEFQEEVIKMLFEYFNPSDGKISTENMVQKLNDSFFGRHILNVENPDRPQSGVAFMGSNRKCLVLPQKNLHSSGWGKEVRKYKQELAKKFIDMGADWTKIVAVGQEKIDREMFKIILHNWHFYISEEMEEELFKTFSQDKEFIDLKQFSDILKKALGADTKYRLSL